LDSSVRVSHIISAVERMRLSKSCDRDSEDLSKLSDEELMKRVSLEDHDACAFLYDRYHKLVFDVAVRILRDSGEAEDVVQIVFLDIFRAAANFDAGKGILKVWVLQYAYHRALHRKRHLVSNHFYNWENLEVAIDIGSERALWGELPEAVRLAEEMLASLKPRERSVLEMSYYGGLTAEEIARQLGESPHVIRHDVRRGLVTLRELLKKAHEKES
jgi:RNA polymerase sigma-70 factor (ECF subfamily)